MANLPLGPGAFAFFALYLAALVGLGVWGRLKRRDGGLADHYLAGRQLGLGVLFLTLFATQYSGNTLFGFTGKAYRIGFAWIMSVQAMMAIVIGYLVFAPGLQRRARPWGLITPGDYIYQRYGSRGLRLLASLCMIYALANYTLAQLKVMGHALVGLSGGRISALHGVVVLALVMVVYETLGGMRSVAWTDALQGLLLLLGFASLLGLAWLTLGGLPAAATAIEQSQPSKIAVPELARDRYWLSMVLLVGIGGSIYPQAIQRIYAAKSAASLRRSLRWMAVMPFVTTGAVLLLGLIAIPRYPNLAKGASEQVLALVLRDVMQASAAGYWTGVILLAAVVAALMSTADSALLSISSMVVRDIYQPHLRPDASDAQLTRLGKVISWVVVALLVWVTTLEDLTLVRLLEVKFEVLIQVAPAFYFGTRWRRVRGRAVLFGLVAGLAVGLLLYATRSKLGGFHPGVIGLAVNVAVTLLATLVAGPARTLASEPSVDAP